MDFGPRMTHNLHMLVLKFIYSEKATKFCEIFTLLLSYLVPVKSKVTISQNFVAFSEYLNFTRIGIELLIKNCKKFDICLATDQE